MPASTAFRIRGRDCCSGKVHGWSPRSGAPKVMQPRHSSETLRPVLPKFLYFMCSAESQFEGVVTHIARPTTDEAAEPLAIVCEQCTRDLFEIREVAGPGRHEVIGRLLPLAGLTVRLVRAPCGLHQFANRDGCAPGLGTKPLPMPRS